MTDDFYTGAPTGSGPVIDDALGRRRQRRARSSFGRLRASTRWSIAVAILVLVIGALGNLIAVPYAVFRPGPATDTLGETSGEDTPARITVKGATTYPTTGELNFTTVSVTGGPGFPVSFWNWLGASVDGHAEVFPVEQVFPADQTQEQVKAENETLMRGSQDNATAVALREAGLTVPERLTITAVAQDSPAKGVLKAGDIVESVGGRAVADVAQVRAELAKVSEGDSVQVGIVRDGAKSTVTATTRADDDGRTVLGIGLGTSFDFPIEVSVDADNVGGSSAGLMFALGIYDVLTPGPLTAGQVVAGTGTIDASGVVGPIGGIRQKIVGAREADATTFFAPSDNCAELEGKVPDGITAYSVRTFDEAKDALVALAASEPVTLPRC